MKGQSGIIVLGGHIQALGIIRIFGRNNIPSVIIDDRKINISRHSRYCIGFYKVSEQGFLYKLREFIRKEKYRGWTIFPTHDLQIELICKNYNELSEYFLLSSDSWERVQYFFNKKQTYNLAAQLDISYPISYYPKDIEDINNLNLTFPCIIKPAVMHSFYSKVKKKVFFCSDAASLLDNYEKACSIINPEEIIIQEIIPGASENQYSVGVLMLNYKPYVSLVARRLRQHPILFGNATTYAETIRNKELEEIAYKLLITSGYTGICEVEFKYDHRDGKYKLLEVNPRTWKWHVIADKAETPFLMTFYNYLHGFPVSEVKGYKDAAFCHFVTDLPVIIELLIKGLYKKPVIRSTKRAVWDIKDPLPAIFEIIYLPFLIITR